MATTPTEKTENVPPKKNGGKRPGSGRKPAVGKEVLSDIKTRIAGHAEELVEVSQGTGVAKEIVKKSRLLILLDTLFSVGSKGDVPAIREYFDRTTGKVPQSITPPPGGGSGRFLLEWETNPEK